MPGIAGYEPVFYRDIASFKTDKAEILQGMIGQHLKQILWVRNEFARLEQCEISQVEIMTDETSFRQGFRSIRQQVLSGIKFRFRQHGISVFNNLDQNAITICKINGAAAAY